MCGDHEANIRGEHIAEEGKVMGRLEGKVAVITGGASGIGEGTVRRFVEEGARVVVSDIQDEPGRALVAELGDACVYHHADVTVEDEVAAAVALAASTFGQIDVMFNNAGIIGAVGSITETSYEAWNRTVGVLLSSVFLGMKHAGAAMVARGGPGSIISTSSTAGGSASGKRLIAGANGRATTRNSRSPVSARSNGKLSVRSLGSGSQ